MPDQAFGGPVVGDFLHFFNPHFVNFLYRYTNLVSYSYGPPSGQVTPRRQIKIRMATESVKLECFTGQNSIVSNYGCLLSFLLRNYEQTLTFILRADEDKWPGALL